MNRNELTRSIDDGVAPHWICPSCDRGELVVDTLDKAELLESKREHEHPEWDPSWGRYSFAGTLKCTHARCGEIVFVLGTGRVDEISGYDEHCGEEYRFYIERLQPTAFQPPLKLFTLPESCPSSVADRIHAAFSTFFISPAAALNETRSAIELVLDDLEIPREIDGRHYSLHSRIEKLDSPHDVHRDQLLAIKWLGNAGSHSVEVTIEDALDALEITEHFLLEKYSRTKERIDLLVKNINAVKGPSR